MRSFRRFARRAGRVLRTRYPRFVLGLPLSDGEVPAFVYHDVDGETLVADLEFLQANGYATLTTQEFVAEQDSPRPRRAVLLSFDDARREFWEIAFPLLRKYRARATLFAPTYWIEGNVASGGENEASARPRFMTWDELRECATSELVDVQPHGHRHALVHVSDRLEGFVTPELLARYDIFEWPMRLGDGLDELGTPPLGTPVFQAAPLHSVARCVLEDADVVQVCRALAARGGGERFFTRPDWKMRLRRVFRDAMSKAPPFRIVKGEMFRQLVASEFQMCAELFERELGFSPRYFCYPWRLGSSLSLRLAADAGFVAAFGVGLDFRRAGRPGPLPTFGRFRADWLRFLPGEGRRQLREVVPKRLRALFRPAHYAH
ncbi:MAG: polysaccharide deacetylase family protein [Gemmatimonadota bacterium]